MSNFEVIKTRLLTQDDFYLLAQIDKQTAMNMFRNKVIIQGPKAGNMKMMKSLMEWIEENLNGLVYVRSENTAKKYNKAFYFETQEDMAGFKLKWM